LEARPAKKLINQKQPLRKRSIHKQSTFLIHEDAILKDTSETTLTAPLPPAKEFQINVKKDQPD
jgi:hypothetical protein